MSLVTDYLTENVSELDNVAQQLFQNYAIQRIKELIYQYAEKNVYEAYTEPQLSERAAESRRFINGQHYSGLVNDNDFLIDGNTLEINLEKELQGTPWGVGTIEIIEKGLKNFNQPFPRPFLKQAIEDYIQNDLRNDIKLTLSSLGYDTSGTDFDYSTDVEVDYEFDGFLD